MDLRQAAVQTDCTRADQPVFEFSNLETRREEAAQLLIRPRVHGKFLFAGDEKLWVRGVTYGTFRPDESGSDFPPQETVARDFAAMARAGFNGVRLYTVPPRWLLDMAAANLLRVMIGVPWEQHITFLDSRRVQASIIARVREGVRQCADHPAVLCYSVGNEIPASVVRWYGPRRIEAFLARLCEVAREEDPGALVTYVNFPTTEYLDLPFVDFVSFNVYLETQERLTAYLARLQNLAGERPLLMAEIGLDSRRNGEEKQAETLSWQIAASFQAGCVGSFVFAWTDEWHRGGHDIEDWDFGLTTRDRRPKPALAAVSGTFREVPFPRSRNWPRISVVVCSYNGARTIEETLSGLERLDYPNFEVIVVDDGSTDATAAIVAQYNVRLFSTPNRGLSNARNLGMNVATGSIVAYIDDDAHPDPHWLTYLADSFMRSDHAGIGGPNLAPPGAGAIADCVANAPGGPVHVLLTDEIAEHIPGCNMAFRKSQLIEVGGCDPQFLVAGDDVDLCWRLQERGWTIGFSPAAMVWHHRRNSVRRYLQQQWGYARAEALLAKKWPEKYNGAGHLTWHGRVYGKGRAAVLLRRHRIYHGTWGSAPFQSLYERAPGTAACLLLMPEWYGILAGLGAFSAAGLVWAPLLLLAPLFVAGLLATIAQAARGGACAAFRSEPLPRLRRFGMKALTTWLHVVQPVARLLGRMQYGLGPWRSTGRITQRPPLPFRFVLWSETWQAPEERLASIEWRLEEAGSVVHRGGDFDEWDLSVMGGLFGSVRALTMVEEHGGGSQLFRLRAWPRVPVAGIVLFASLALLSTAALAEGSQVAGLGLAGAALVIAVRAYTDCAGAMDRLRRGLHQSARVAAEDVGPGLQLETA